MSQIFLRATSDIPKSAATFVIGRDHTRSYIARRVSSCSCISSSDNRATEQEALLARRLRRSRANGRLPAQFHTGSTRRVLAIRQRRNIKSSSPARSRSADERCAELDEFSVQQATFRMLLGRSSSAHRPRSRCTCGFANLWSSGLVAQVCGKGRRQEVTARE